jgi:branched-chain amino acid transport system substrate-binding protein
MLATPLLAAEQFPDGYPGKKEALEFVKAYEAKFGARNFFASLVWSSLKIIESAVPKALKVAKPGTEQFRVALRDAIEKTKGLKGAGTVYTMSNIDHTGINELGMCVLRVENNTWKLDDHAEFK